MLKKTAGNLAKTDTNRHKDHSIYGGQVKSAVFIGFELSRCYPFSDLYSVGISKKDFLFL